MSELPEGWALGRIDESNGVGGVSTDGDWIESKDQDPNGDVRLIQLQDIGDGYFVDKSARFLTKDRAEELNCTFLRAGDVLIARMPDPLGRACRFPDINQEAVTAVDVHVWRPGELSADPDYVKYCINSPEIRAALQSQASGTTRQRVAGGKLKAQEIPVPPLLEQRRIVRKLDTLSARTAAARTHLTAIAKLVEKYKHGFLSLIFENLERPTDELRELTSLVTSGSRGWAKYYSDDGPLFIRVGDTRRGSPVLDLSDVQHVRPPDDGEGKRTKLVAGDLVISITADLGRVGVVPGGVEEAYVNQHIALVRPHEVESSKFIAWYLISPPGQVQLFENDRGATKAGLGLDDIRDVMIPRCKREEQRAIVKQIETAFATIDRLAAEAEKALTLTDRLDQRILAKAFAGELVPQNPNDEPASVLLDRIREARANAPKRKRQPGKPRTMKKKPNLASLLDDWPSTGLTFEELRGRSSGTYEQVKEELFDLMTGDQPRIRQEFDASEKTMRLKKVGS
ncbi:restriction endonuclease subunit S [Flavimaricola marinus]|uniref:Type-1 restriction enzyme EcoKI specificity protein n=1 Tax=Flavimaricola marinus TaxID=1819565 RepID=A0A238LCT7_9RHOB|nr:restriction endonuclease subunit S [Flavimaricola marinus]SMY07235.1 Type-1 restriction enzyme EcoKI specificity protein [Flavimaricola marinus]